MLLQLRQMLTAVPRSGLLTALGGFILCLSFASDFSYPNLNTYLISYMRSTGLNPGLTYSDFVILSSVKILAQGVSMPFVGALSRRLGCRVSIVIGVIIYSGGFMLTSLTCRSTFPLAVLSLASHGLAFSFCYATAIGAAQLWFPAGRRGLAGSLVVSGYGFGSLVWVPLQTVLVNPSNLPASLERGCSRPDCQLYYTDPALLDRVPNMFLVLGAVFLVMGLTAAYLISEPDKPQLEESEEQFSLRPTQVLQTRLFYQIWIGFFAIYLTNGMMGNFSKTFSLTFINDDFYYARVSIFLNLLNGLCRVFWGLAYDRFGFRACFLVVAAVVVVVTASLPLLPLLASPDSLPAKLGYALMMGALYFTFPGIYSIVAAAVRAGFGSDHYRANFGLLFSQTVANCGLLLLLTRLPALAALGYPALFLVAAGCGIIGSVAVYFTPTNLSSEHFRPKFNPA